MLTPPQLLLGVDLLGGGEKGEGESWEGKVGEGKRKGEEGRKS